MIIQIVLLEAGRMLVFKFRCQLVVAGYFDQRTFFKQISQQADACRTPVLCKSVWHDQAGMSCEIGH